MKIDKGRKEYLHWVCRSGSPIEMLEFIQELVEEDQLRARSMTQAIALGDLFNGITRVIETLKKSEE